MTEIRTIKDLGELPDDPDKHTQAQRALMERAWGAFQTGDDHTAATLDGRVGRVERSSRTRHPIL